MWAIVSTTGPMARGSWNAGTYCDLLLTRVHVNGFWISPNKIAPLPPLAARLSQLFPLLRWPWRWEEQTCHCVKCKLEMFLSSAPSRHLRRSADGKEAAVGEADYENNLFFLV